jgi:hypothetical protein
LNEDLPTSCDRFRQRLGFGEKEDFALVVGGLGDAVLEHEGGPRSGSVVV